MSAKGLEQIPNYRFWEDFGNLQAVSEALSLLLAHEIVPLSKLASMSNLFQREHRKLSWGFNPHLERGVVSLSKTLYPHCLVLVKPRMPSQNY